MFLGQFSINKGIDATGPPGVTIIDCSRMGIRITFPPFDGYRPRAEEGRAGDLLVIIPLDSGSLF